MPRHDIIDNRNEKLVDHIKQILWSTEAGRLVVFVTALAEVEEAEGGREER